MVAISFEYSRLNRFLSTTHFQSDQSVHSLTVFMQAIGEGSEPVPIWQIVNHEYGVWLPGRVLIKAEGDYKVKD